MDVNTSVRSAAAQLLTPQEEQGEESTLEQESPEEAQEQEVLEDDEEVSPDDEQDEDSEEPELDEEDDESTESQDDDDKYTVKVDGEEYEVNLSELIKGYQLERNTTKKSQQLADEKKQLQSLKTELESERDKYLQATAQVAEQSYTELKRAQEQLKTINREDDPVGYLSKQSEIVDIERGLEQQVQQFRQTQAQQQEEAQKARAALVQEQQGILEKSLDGWGDPEKGPEIRKAISEFGANVGYTQEELQNVVDARDIVVLNKARLYDELMERRNKVAKKKAPARPSVKIKSGASTSNSTKRARLVKDKRDKLKTTGSAKDAAALMVELMQNRSTRR